MNHDLPPLSSVLSLLMREDSRRRAMGITPENDSENSEHTKAVFATDWKNKGNFCKKFHPHGSDKKTIICSYCKKGGAFKRKMMELAWETY
ncbi:hypothetical protein QML37_31165 [Klebsiella pneumoniae]|uniref:hypothetical protein n=1 Tax=Klebsiella pneumoniae TaxID=573 RepID=UPI003A80C9A4